MANQIEITDLPTHITGSMSRSNKIVLCDRCQGYGFFDRDELSDYHKREYKSYSSPCNKCEGDGRMIISTEHMSFNLGGDKDFAMPYISFKDFVDPHGYVDRWFRYRLDKTNLNLEAKYPELAAVNYDNYDRLVEQYQVIEILKKEEK